MYDRKTTKFCKAIILKLKKKKKEELKNKVTMVWLSYSNSETLIWVALYSSPKFGMLII